MKNLWAPGAVVVASAPLRVDLSGMTDYILAQGWCVNATIGLSAKARFEARKDNLVVIDAGSYGVETFGVSDIGSSDNMFMKAMALNGYDFPFGLNVDVNCEFGAIGLSSSSSVASLYNVFARLIMAKPYDPLELVRHTQASEPHWYGRQDQLSVVEGGMSLWHMLPGKVKNDKATAFGKIEKYPIVMPKGLREALAEDSFLLYHSGIEEGASAVLNAVRDNYDKDPSVRKIFGSLNCAAQDIYKILSRPKDDLRWLYDLGRVFDGIREDHEQLHPTVTNPRMQDLFKAARAAGALGGRYSGAGGRGALTFICLPGKTANVARALNAVVTPYEGEKKTYNEGRQIHFGGFTENRAEAWFEA